MSSKSEASQRKLLLEKSWAEHVGDEFEKDYMHSLRSFLLRQKQEGKQIFPPGSEIFAALNTTTFTNTRVVILGQDPYHGIGQAHGLCFSVKVGQKIPPSLRNVYKELKEDLQIEPPNHGYLMGWAEQGVLMLNSVLTVENGMAGSHQGKGWERFTDSVVDSLNQKREGLVFLLWGSYAQKKGEMIDRQKHLVLTSVHPSPLSASRGFFGNHHFSKTNDYLRKAGNVEINWKLEPIP